MSVRFFETPPAVFLRIRKAGSTSIVKGLFGGRENASKIFDGEFPEEFRDRFTFTIVRNPFERLVSCLTMFRDYPVGSEAAEQLKASLDLNKVMDVVEDESIEIGRANYAAKLKQHAIAMTHPSYFLETADFVGRLENFGEDYRHIADTLGVKAEDTPHFRRSDPRDYRAFYDEQTKARAMQVYARDLESFDYAF